MATCLSVRPAAADGRLYMHIADGTMVLAKVDSDAYVEVGSFRISHSGERPSWAHPVILNGRRYLRDNNAIHCYDLQDRTSSKTPC